ncbi:MAG: sigma-54-dependent Fis family transcriptional regulator, partial [Sphingomonadales bacterium]|nr:sigma-54-dependent Fis family transcriptional regulator [Sphingomonadales bacterium]
FVDDDQMQRAAHSQTLELTGIDVETFAAARDALERLDPDFNGVVVSDVRMPGMDGLAFFEAVREIDASIPFILITGHGDIAMAVTALQNGAHDFLSKPFAADHFVATVRRGLEHRQLILDNRALRARIEQEEAVGVVSPLLGETPVMVQLRNTVTQVADANVDVLIEGETGVGKELVARLLHRGSARRSRPFIAVNCGALPDEIAERQLFGEEGYSERGRSAIGRVEAANGGTLFLDEIDSMSPALQVRMLRILEEREVLPLGAKEPRHIDVRVIAASKRNLEEAVAEGRFREDLLYRINIIRLRVPPLRERRTDIPLLFAHFTAEAAKQMRREPRALSDVSRRHLLEHGWPGNVRELKNFAFRAMLDIDGGENGLAPDGLATLPQRVERFEATVIEGVLAECSGDVASALAMLGIPRKTFYDKLTRHAINIKAFRR